MIKILKKSGLLRIHTAPLDLNLVNGNGSGVCDSTLGRSCFVSGHLPWKS